MPGMTPEERRIRNALAAQPTVTDTSQSTPTQIMSQRNDLQREINQTIKLTVDDNSVVLRDGTIPFEAPQKGKEPTLATHLATKSYVDSTDAGKLTSVIDAAATPGTGGQHGNLPSGHVCLIEDGGDSQDKATLYNVASANANLTIEDDEDGSGNAFIKFTAADQSVSLHRFDAIYAEDEENVTTTYANASGSNGIVFQDTEETTWTIGALSNNKIDVTLDVDLPSAVTYSTNASTVSGGANLNLVPSSGSTDTLKFASAGATTVSRTDASTITISSTNTQNTYTSSWVDSSADVLLRLTGGGATSGTQDIKLVAGNNVSLTPSGTNLTIDSPDTNTTNMTSTAATDDGAGIYDIRDSASELLAFKQGTGIDISIVASGGADYLQIASTVDTSGLLTNGLVKVEDYNGSEVEEYANASGGDTIRFVENDGIEWSISGPTSNVISVTPSFDLSGYATSGHHHNSAYAALSHSHAYISTSHQANNITSTHITVLGNTSGTNSGDQTLPTRTSLGIDSDDAVTFGALQCPTLNTGQGAYELYAMNQDVETTDAVTFATVNTGQGANELYDMNQNVLTSSDVQFDSFGVGTAASGTTGEIRATNEVTAYYSDDRLKNKYGNIEDALKKVCSLNGFHYQANELAGTFGYDTSKKQVGVSAQECLKVMPEVVASAPIDAEYYTVHYEKLVPLLIEAIKELSERKCSCGV